MKNRLVRVFSKGKLDWPINIYIIKSIQERQEREERIERRKKRIARQKKEFARKEDRERRARIKKNMEERKNKNSEKVAKALLKKAEEQLIADLGLQEKKNAKQRKSKSY